MLFIMGMYWCAEPVALLTEMMRIRDCRPSAPLSLVAVERRAVSGSPKWVSEDVSPPWASAHAIVRRLMWVRASVNAPAIIVEVLLSTSVRLVESIRCLRLDVTCSSTILNGRYLFTCLSLLLSLLLPSAVIVMSPSASSCDVEDAEGYNHVAL